jgi:hypothetical protein
MPTVRELNQAAEARADLHQHQADRAWGLGAAARDRTATREPDEERAFAAASRAFWAAGDAHANASQAHEIAQACNTPSVRGEEAWDTEDGNQDEFDYAMEATHTAVGATKAAFRAWKAADARDEITAANEAEQAARLVRETEDIAERCLNGR